MRMLRLVQVHELPAGDPLDSLMSHHVLVVEQGVGPSVAEGASHCHSGYYALRDMSNAANQGSIPGWLGSSTMV